MDILWVKVVALLAIFSVGMTAGMVPTRSKLSEQGSRRLTLGNAFAGGVFLGAGLLHMLPDAQDNFSQLALGVDYPIPILVAGLGFLLILLLEKAVLAGDEGVGNSDSSRGAYPFILCVILSVHSIIAGVSLGLEDSLATATAILIAILAHKGAASFALGVSLQQGGFAMRRHVMVIAFFSLMTPLGVILGTGFAATLSDQSAVAFEALFDALAAGTFLYVAAVDILEEVFEKTSDRWSKVLLIHVGFALMALVAIWT